LKEFLKGKEDAKVKGGLVEGVFADAQKVRLPCISTKQGSACCSTIGCITSTYYKLCTCYLMLYHKKAVLVLDAIRKEKEKQS
jgi:large subunit ribosomal protein L10